MWLNYLSPYNTTHLFPQVNIARNLMFSQEVLFKGDFTIICSSSVSLAEIQNSRLHEVAKQCFFNKRRNSVKSKGKIQLWPYWKFRLSRSKRELVEAPFTKSVMYVGAIFMSLDCIFCSKSLDHEKERLPKLPPNITPPRGSGRWVAFLNQLITYL